MAPNGTAIELGAFDGATTYPTAMPLQLLALAATIFATLTVSLARVIVLAISALTSMLAIAVVGFAALAKQISALDLQLDRLTGIANTHGISELSVFSTAWPILWIACEVATAAWLCLAIVWQKNWQTTSKADRPARSLKTKNPKTPRSAIELWDEQRD